VIREVTVKSRADELREEFGLPSEQKSREGFGLP
jgi:hypothetical protein